MSEFNHKDYVDTGVAEICAGLELLRRSYQKSGNALLGAIIHNIEAQLSMIDGRNELYPKSVD